MLRQSPFEMLSVRLYVRPAGTRLLVTSEASLLVVQMEPLLSIYIYIVQPTLLAPGWPHDNRGNRVSPAESVYALGRIGIESV